MLVDLIDGVPTWVMASVVIAIIVGLLLIGLVISSSVIHLEMRRKHSESAGFDLAPVGVFFAVLLALIAVAAWESFGNAGDTALITVLILAFDYPFRARCRSRRTPSVTLRPI